MNRRSFFRNCLAGAVLGLAKNLPMLSATTDNPYADVVDRLEAAGFDVIKPRSTHYQVWLGSKVYDVVTENGVITYSSERLNPFCLREEDSGCLRAAIKAGITDPYKPSGNGDRWSTIIDPSPSTNRP